MSGEDPGSSRGDGEGYPGLKSYDPERPFTLFLNGQALLDFHVRLASAKWQNLAGTVTLVYEVLQANRQDSSGFMRLTLPASLLQPGQPAQLAVRPTAAGSCHWFGLYHAPR